MRVRKCDICESIFDEYPVGKSAIMEVRTRESAYSVIGSKEIDCCPKCTEKMLNLLDIQSKEADIIK